MRIGEICALRWSDIDFSHQVLTVNGTLKQFKDTGFFIDTPKSLTSRRVVPLLPAICKMLKRRKRSQVGTVMGKYTVDSMWKDLVFLRPGKADEPMSKRTIAYDISIRIGKRRPERDTVVRRSLSMFPRMPSAIPLRHGLLRMAYRRKSYRRYWDTAA